MQVLLQKGSVQTTQVRIQAQILPWGSTCRGFCLTWCYQWKRFLHGTRSVASPFTHAANATAPGPTSPWAQPSKMSISRQSDTPISKASSAEVSTTVPRGTECHQEILPPAHPARRDRRKAWHGREKASATISYSPSPAYGERSPGKPRAVRPRARRGRFHEQYR